MHCRGGCAPQRRAKLLLRWLHGTTPMALSQSYDKGWFILLYLHTFWKIYSTWYHNLSWSHAAAARHLFDPLCAAVFLVCLLARAVSAQLQVMEIKAIGRHLPPATWPHPGRHRPESMVRWKCVSNSSAEDLRKVQGIHSLSLSLSVSVSLCLSLPLSLSN